MSKKSTSVKFAVISILKSILLKIFLQCVDGFENNQNICEILNIKNVFFLFNIYVYIPINK